MIGCAMIDLLVFHPLSYTVVRVLYAYLKLPNSILWATISLHAGHRAWNWSLGPSFPDSSPDLLWSPDSRWESAFYTDAVNNIEALAESRLPNRDLYDFGSGVEQVIYGRTESSLLVAMHHHIMWISISFSVVEEVSRRGEKIQKGQDLLVFKLG